MINARHLVPRSLLSLNNNAAVIVAQKSCLTAVLSCKISASNSANAGSVPPHLEQIMHA